MKDVEIDAYLDFFEEKLISKTKIPKRMEDLGRYFPEPSTKPSQLEKVASESYSTRIDSLTRSLYSSSSSISIRQPNELSSNDYPSYPFSTTSDSLPNLLSTLLTSICQHVLPIPISLPSGFQGSVPTIETTSLNYLLPQINLIERLLALRSVPLQKELARKVRIEERELWNETKKLAKEFVKDQSNGEKNRRKELDRQVEILRKERMEQKKVAKEKRRKKRLGGGGGGKEIIGESSEEEIEKEIEQELRVQEEFKSKSVIGTSDEEEEEGSNTSDEEGTGSEGGDFASDEEEAEESDE